MTTSRDPLAELIEKTFREGRREGLSISDTADLVAAGMRTHLENRVKDQAQIDKNLIRVQSILGATSGLPLVDFLIGLEHFSLEVEAAQQYALTILQCAESATQDAAVYRWLTLSELGLDSVRAAAAVGDLRRFRGDVEKELWR